MNSFEVLVSAIVRFQGTMVVSGEDGLQGSASFNTLEQAAGFASALEEGFDVTDAEPYLCPIHEDEKGWEVHFVKCEEV